MEHFQAVIEVLMQIQEDPSVPKNIRTEIQQTIQDLDCCEGQAALNCDKSLEKLDELSNNPNVPTHTRAEIWSVVSMLESTR